MLKISPKNRFPEALVVKLWQCQLLDRTDLATEDGEPLRVIYPGRISNDQGADLQDAVIATSQGLIKGDIEIHVKSSDWRAHKHHQDPAYNRVILHVTYWRDTEADTGLQSEVRVPILALHKYISNPAFHGQSPSCFLTGSSIPYHRVNPYSDTVFMGEYLDSAGEERFSAKAAGFHSDLSQTEASQVLYQGIMVALGYAKNKIPFLELSRRLPLSMLMSSAQDNISDEDFLTRQQGLLLGTAGLLPSQRSNRFHSNHRNVIWIDKLESAWFTFSHSQPMSESDWYFFKVRPANSPIRRMAAMSYLTLRYREKGILDGLINDLRESPADTGYRKLEKALTVNTHSYPGNHANFSLIGNRRAADIAINILLPFAFAWGNLNSQPELARRAYNLYRCYPKLAANAVEKHMSRQLGLNHSQATSALRQQGLIHIYKTMCSQGKCGYCPLNHRTAPIY